MLKVIIKVIKRYNLNQIIKSLESCQLHNDEDISYYKALSSKKQFPNK